MPRPLELLLAGGLLLILLPAAVVSAIAVGLRLGRPVFFRQVRAGCGGPPITLFKLRTMRDDKGPDGRLLPDEARLTQLGRALRRYRLDEVPQLWAVLTGDLSLVGPRPLLPSTVEAFGQDGRERGRVRPGITGWAQVSGNTRLRDDEKLSLDLWYVAHRSTALDLRILWLTILTVLRGETRDETRISGAHLWCASRRTEGASPSTRAAQEGV